MKPLNHNHAMPVPALPVAARRSMTVRAAINQAVCVLIALVLWLFRVDNSFWTGLVFSLLIGNACWLLIDAGRLVVGRWLYARRGGIPDWPGWPFMAPIVVLGTLIGYTGGHALAKALLGLPTTKAVLQTPVLAFSVIAAMVVSYLFYARERMHSHHLAAVAAERLASETQLKLLQSQLEPHMLFNTLANLRVLIGLDPPQAQAMLDHLIAFLRTTLAATRADRHPLATEFDALRDYLALMAVRMGARLQTQLDLPDALRSLDVPPLLLQPLVENAIKHGLEPQVEGGRIDVQARRLRDELHLRVRDTGVGLAAAGASTGGTAFGLDQVRQRLSRLYGERARFELRTPADGLGGAEALIVLPLPPEA
jgi:signal transduction histidine kinase